MAYAIVRVKKHKKGSLAGVGNHNRRETPQPHVSPDGKHEILVGQNHKTTAHAVSERIEALDIKRIRKDAVVAVELMCSASPEYFRPENPENWGEWDEQRTKDWANNTMNHLTEKYGDNLVEAVMHLDEATPHIHAIVVPAVEKTRNKRRTKEQISSNAPAETYQAVTLDAKNLFDRSALIQIQDEYAEALKPLQIKRGMRKSRAEHETLKSYYSTVKDLSVSEPKLKKIKVPTPKPMIKEKTREDWATAISKKINNHYQKQLKSMVEGVRNAVAKANDYKRRFLKEKQRNEAYQNLGTPEEIQAQITDLENKNYKIFNKLSTENKELKHNLKHFTSRAERAEHELNDFKAQFQEKQNKTEAPKTPERSLRDDFKPQGLR